MKEKEWVAIRMGGISGCVCHARCNKGGSGGNITLCGVIRPALGQLGACRCMGWGVD